MKIEYVGKCLLIEKNEERVLVIGDLHLGYEEYLNRTGVFVSRKMFDEMIEELNEVFEKIKEVNRIVLLGDIKHDFGNILKQEWKEVGLLFDYLRKKCDEIVTLKGNHDNILENILRKKNIFLKNFYIWGEFCFLHGDKSFDEIYDNRIKYWILGHGHPAVKIGDGIKTEKYKCFLVGKYSSKKIIILPSFFNYTEGSDPRENDLGFAWDFKLEDFEVKVTGEKLIIFDFGSLKNIN